MKIEDIQTFCHSLPGTTEDLKWGCDIVFSVGKKMYAVIGMVEKGPIPVSFKTTPEIYGQLIQHEDIVPAPYAARFHWVMLKHPDALEDDLLVSFIRDSYNLVFAKLTKKLKNAIESGETGV